MADSKRVPDVLMIGTGEYTTGYVHGSSSQSDKKIGVVGLVLFDLRRRGKVGNLSMVGTNGTKFPGIREHFKRNISEKYNGLDVSFRSYPNDDVERDEKAYISALDDLKPGDCCTVFTPDDTHYAITKAAIERGVHVMLTKPPVHKLDEHNELMALAKEKGVLVCIEVHKRWDPIYSDACGRIRQQLGEFVYFNSYMSQPKFQLATFKAWAGKSSDISYYLNSHHIDFHCWALQGRARPIQVVAMGSRGVANKEPFDIDTEDSISLMVQWKSDTDQTTIGTALYTAGWVSPKSDVHSQQRFHYIGSKGEIMADQAHRGYTVAHDEFGYASVNPLYMKYTPDEQGNFNGQLGYGYRSFDSFIDAVDQIQSKTQTTESFDSQLPTLTTTSTLTAILQAGRLSLDNQSRRVVIQYDSNKLPSSLEVVQ